MKFFKKNNLYLLLLMFRLLLERSRWTQTRGRTNSPTSTTTCSPRNWAVNGD